VWHEVPRYAAISLTSLLLNTLGVVLLTDGLRWNPLVAAALVGVLVAVGWNLPLHRYYVFRHGAHRPRPGLAWIGALASGTAAVAVLFVAYGMPFAEEGVHGFSTQIDDAAKVTQTSYLPKLLPEAFYSESYSFLFQADDGTFARVQFLVSNAGLEGHGGAAARAVLVGANGKTIEDAEAFEAGQWRVLPEGAIEMGAHSLTMGPDASHHVHFAGKKLVIDATVLPQTQAVRPGGGRVTFDAGGRAVFDQTIFALRSKFDGTVWSSDRGGRRVRGYCYADTSYSTMPAYKSASLWYRMEAFDDADGTTAALAVLIPPEGSRVAPQGWLYTSRDGHTEVRSSDVKLSFEKPRREAGGRFEYDVPQRVVASARGARGEKVTVTIDAKRLLYKEDVLGEMGPLSRFLISVMAAPMTYTYEYHYDLRIERPGAPADYRDGTALSEFAYANAPKQVAQF
jgi:putative flippase GtrA